VVKSAHDCSEGGIAVALAECCISRQIARETPRLLGAEIDLTVPGSQNSEERQEGGEIPTAAVRSAPLAPRSDALLFGETQGRIIISVAGVNAGKVLAQAKILGVPATRLGTVGGEQLKIKTDQTTLNADLRELHDSWWNSIARAMK
jgi:phosphoribosylformylglycinamidine synthase subunit PurL